MLKKHLTQITRPLLSLIFHHRSRLKPERMIEAYRKGYFPMTTEFGFLRWHNPEQRAIVPLDERFHMGKRLTKKIESHTFEVTFDCAFSKVIRECARTKPGRDSTWISHEIIDSSIRLHELGYAHSVEVWHEGKLVGGEYGIAIGGLYSGESMFNCEDYASRVAMVYLVNHLRERGFVLLDSQIINATAREFGAFEVERDEYMKLLADALSRDVSF
jgi:leucyl/phenylalanyl-tRNA---protein transferase